MRLTALSEAGGRGPWSNAAEINLLSGVPRDDPRLGAVERRASASRWSRAAAQLPNGKLLTWSAYQPDTFGGGTVGPRPPFFDPVTGAVTGRTVTKTGHDMFCPGTSMLPDGRILVSGGTTAARPASTTRRRTPGPGAGA